MVMLQDQINVQNDVINKQTELINSLVKTVTEQEIELQRHASLFAVKDCVFKALEKELHRLQQYTRRYSVVVSGIDKKKGEKKEDLTKEVEALVGKVQSSSSMIDVDKYHRNGPNKDGEQDVIIRFKSHSAKEAFYRERKSANDDSIKIRPSLCPHNKSLLYAAKQHLEELEKDSYQLKNAPHFVFANVHGDIQVKFHENVGKKGMFFGFDTVDELSCIITNAQSPEQSRQTHRDRGVFDVNHNATNSDDDMGFSLFP